MFETAPPPARSPFSGRGGTAPRPHDPREPERDPHEDDIRALEPLLTPGWLHVLDGG